MLRRPRTVTLATLGALALASCGASPPARDTAALDAAPGEPPAVVQPAEEPELPVREGPEQRCKAPGRSDINGDGFADAVVSEPGGGPPDGGFRVLYGTPDGLTNQRRDDQQFDRSTPGIPKAPSPDLSDGWGRSLAVADFDGDGCADVAVGAPGEAAPGTPAIGSVTVLYGTSGGLRTKGLDTLRVPGKGEREDEFGNDLAAGDFDGDGLADLAITAPGDVAGEKRRYQPMPGAEGQPRPTSSCPPTALCMPRMPKPARHTGSVTIVYGSAAGLGEGSRPARSFTGADLDGPAGWRSELGQGVAAGDFDGDGTEDLAVSSWWRGKSGRNAVHVLPGAKGAGLGRAEPRWFDARHGGAALAAGDLDGNGTDDLAVGAPYAGWSGPNTGSVVVLYSRAGTGLTREGAQEWTPTSPGLPAPTGAADFGEGLAIGQFGGPGKAQDLAIGAPSSFGGAKKWNSVTVLFGAAGGLSAHGSVQLVPAANGSLDRFGAALAARAVRGGAYDDLLVGAPRAGALDVYPTGPAGPSPDDVRRFRPGDSGMAGGADHGGFGHAIG